MPARGSGTVVGVRNRLLGGCSALVCVIAAVVAVPDGAARIDAPVPLGDADIAPRPPGAYQVPAGAIKVRSARQLSAALHRRGRRAIVLAPGTYGGGRPFLNPHGHRLYSAVPRAARLTAGISLGSNSRVRGALVQGLTFDIARPSRALEGAAIDIWGRSRGARILDTVIRGHGLLDSGIRARVPTGLVVERVVASGFASYGLMIDANDRGRGVLTNPFRVEDVDVSDVARRPVGSSNGRAEACIWVGNTGLVHRARVRHCGVSGIWTGSATKRATFDGVDIDHAPTGVYVEHFTHNTAFRSLHVGNAVRIGLNAEWADPAWDHLPASVDNLIEQSHFESWFAGVYLDEGTTRTTVRHNTFIGQRWTGIGNYRGVGNAQYDNVGASLAPGALLYREAHPSSYRP
jgi:hypothetical protein